MRRGVATGGAFYSAKKWGAPPFTAASASELLTTCFHKKKHEIFVQPDFFLTKTKNMVTYD